MIVFWNREERQLYFKRSQSNRKLELRVQLKNYLFIYLVVKDCSYSLQHQDFACVIGTNSFRESIRTVIKSI